MTAMSGPRPRLVALALLVLAAGAAVVLLDRGHPWVTPDSVSYLGVAHNLHAGHGVTSPFRSTLDPFSAVPSSTVPFVRWPPGYPLLLASVMVTGVSGTTAAEILNVVAAMVLVGAVGLVMWRVTGRTSLSLGGAALVLLDVAVVQNGRFVLSDLVLAALVAVFLYVSSAVLDGSTWAPGVLAGVTSLAALDRWVGLALVVPAGVACAWNQPRRVAVVRSAVQVGVPLAVVAVSVAVQGGQPRDVAWHPALTPGAAVRAFGSWVSPSGESGVWLLVMGTLLLAGVVAAVLWGTTRSRRPFRTVVAVTLVSYMAGLILTRLLLDANVPWDDRILAPVGLLVIVLVVDLVDDAGVRLRAVLLVVMALFVVCQASQWPALVRQGDQPQWYSAASWQDQPFATIDARLAPDHVLVSNRPDVLYYLGHRSSPTVPQRYSPVTREPNRSVAAQLVALSAALGPHGAVVLYDDPENPRAYLVPGPRLVQALQVHLVASIDGWRIYRR